MSVARQYSQATPASPTGSTDSQLSGMGSVSSNEPSSNSFSALRLSDSELEAKLYYEGISPTPPKLVYRSGKKPWVKPHPRDLPRFKELRGVFGHKLNTTWHVVGPRVLERLDADKVAWSSIDVVRFLADRDGSGEKILSPVVIWVGVLPGSLLGEDASNSANHIITILLDSGIDDVEVEFRESVYQRLAASTLLPPVPEFLREPTRAFRGALTPILGLPIATSDCQGTMALYFAEDEREDSNVLGLTCRHVLFRPDSSTNSDYVSEDAARGARCIDVQLLGDGGFDTLLASVEARTGKLDSSVNDYESKIKELEEKKEYLTEQERTQSRMDGRLKWNQDKLHDTTKEAEALNRFRLYLKDEWGTPDQRKIGFARSSPAVKYYVQPEGFTEDWGAFQLDKAKFKEAFNGNFIDLGPEISREDFVSLMHPRVDSGSTFKYPDDGLLPLRGIMSEDRMLRPNMLDGNGEPCLLVIKNGHATGVTVGRATGIFSYVRRREAGHGGQTTGREWAVFGYDGKTQASFSAKGDSGSAIVNGSGEVGGMLTGGTGKEGGDVPDIAYATPMFWLWPRIKKQFPGAHLYPTSMA